MNKRTAGQTTIIANKTMLCFKRSAVSVSTAESSPQVVSTTYSTAAAMTTTPPSLDVTVERSGPTNKKKSTMSSTTNKVIYQFVTKTGLNTTITREVVDIFEREGFDSLTALKTLTSQDLKDMNIKTGHARVLLPAINKLKDTVQRVDHTIATSSNPALRGTRSLHSSTSSSSTSSVVVDLRVKSWLHGLPGNMDIYGTELARRGFDSLEAICLMENQDVAAIIPEHKSGHVKVFQRAWEHLKTRMMLDNGTHGLGRDIDKYDTNGLFLKKKKKTKKTKKNKNDMNETNEIESYDDEDEDEETPLPIDTPHVYVMSGRCRVPQHMKRHIGDGEWKRWDVFPQTSERYNYLTDTWSSIDVDPCWGAGVACGDGDGHVYSLAGLSWSPFRSLVEMSSPSVVGRTWGDVTYVSNAGKDGEGLLFAAGGYGGGVSANGRNVTSRDSGDDLRKGRGKGLTHVVDVYEVGVGSWKNVNPLRTPRHSLSLAGTCRGYRTKGVIYASGGSASRGSAVSSSSSSMSLNQAMNQAAAGRSSLTTLDGLLGKDLSSNVVTGKGKTGGRSASSLVEMYDIALDRWDQSTSEMSMKRMGHGSLTDESGCLYVLGGSNTKSRHLRHVEFYDHRVGRWSNLPPMMNGRSFFGTERLPNGDIMAIGGKHSQAWSTSCEILDVKSGRWRVAASMSQQRHSVPHTTYSSSLSSGRRPRGYSVCLA